MRTEYIMKHKGYDISDITIEDMPNELFRDIYELSGKDVAISLLRDFSGNRIVVPTNGFNIIEKKIILREYDGSTLSIQRLARNLGKGESSIREILKSYKIVPAENGQLGLFKKGEY